MAEPNRHLTNSGTIRAGWMGGFLTCSTFGISPLATKKVVNVRLISVAAQYRGGVVLRSVRFEL